MSDVIRLVPPARPAKQEPNSEVIAQLKILLDLAEQGSVVSLAYIAIGDAESAPAIGHSGKSRNALCAGLPMLADELMWRRVS